MIKTIFVPTSGSQTDDNVFATALAVGRPLAAHLEFYHLRLSPSEAAVRSPHVQFCAVPAINDAFGRLQERDDDLSAVARGHFEEFCKANGVTIRQAPSAPEELSAAWVEEPDEAERRLMFRARHSDLVVLGRQQHDDFMPYNLIERLLMGRGRPILIAPAAPPAGQTGTVIAGWNETPEASRALTAALPLMKGARRVVLVNVEEDRAPMVEDLEHLVRQLQWHGIAAEPLSISRKSAEGPRQLIDLAVEMHADLLVVGGYGHKPLREAVCGGVTRSLIEGADVPVFMMH